MIWLGQNFINKDWGRGKKTQEKMSHFCQSKNRKHRKDLKYVNTINMHVLTFGNISTNIGLHTDVGNIENGLIWYILNKTFLPLTLKLMFKMHNNSNITVDTQVICIY